MLQNDKRRNIPTSIRELTFIYDEEHQRTNNLCRLNMDSLDMAELLGRHGTGLGVKLDCEPKQSKN